MRARLAIRVSQTQVELREVLLRDKPQCMLDASAKGTVPVLVRDGEPVLDESLDVMLWALAQSDPEAWLSPERQAMLALIEQFDTGFKYHLDRYKYASRYPGADALAHREAAAKHLHELEQRLQAKAFLCSGKPSLADMAIAPFVRQFALTDREWFDAQNWPALCDWLERIVGSESFAAVMKKYPQWRAGDPVARFPDR